ncbi:MAG: transporter [Deltaproteobacteria bacterium]|jgi:hypothetical protein|nr:transporter [Deltaproteobacteria bacterium]
MRKLFVLTLVFLGFFIVTKPQDAFSKAHFTPGGSGYMLASMPPPGLYYLMYNAWYQASDYVDDRGRKLNFPHTSTKVFSQTHRFVWSTDVNILGGNLILDLVVPLTHYDLGRTLVGGGDERHFGLGDPYSHVTIAWHGERYDALLSTAVHFPIGEYRENEVTSAGLGYWGLQPTAGLTLYFDEAKTWTWSTVIRYEISYDQRKTDLREGQNFHMESSIGKQLGNVALAASTAGSWQTTDARGKGLANGDRTKFFSLGPEVVVGIGRWGNLSLRCLFDLTVRNNPKGSMTVLTWTVPIFITGQDL